MKELIYTNFQLTRATGVPTLVVIDGVLIEMRKRGGPGAAQVKTKAKGKAKKPAQKARGAKDKQEHSAKASKPVRRAEAAPQ